MFRLIEYLMSRSIIAERAILMQISVNKTKSSTGLPYKWIVAFTVVFGIFMSILDSTIVNIAIPHLQDAFGVSLNAVQWVLTAYTLAQGVATPLTAYLAARLGTKRSVAWRGTCLRSFSFASCKQQEELSSHRSL